MAAGGTTGTFQDTLVVGTAGHIDHGKTTLVRALTGVDLDTLPEERERGITIALGFTDLLLPSGRRVAFVDVPGHERLVRTMVAGACGLDAVMLCVSAVEGVMPQTREHLDILGVLGVEQGFVALTMSDLVDEEMLELAREDVADAVAGTFLEGAPVVPCSGRTGAGREAVLGALAALVPRPRPVDGPFVLPVDRAFVRQGFGVVATGTVRSGRVEVGDELALLPAGERVRVRGVQVHGRSVRTSVAGNRTALNLAGARRESVSRGVVVATPGGVAVTSILDVAYRHLPGAPPLPSRSRVRLLLGTAEVLAVADRLDGPRLDPGSAAWLQLRCEAPVACRPGDRFVLRRASPVETLGGGEVVDPWAPRVRRREARRAVAHLERLRAGDRLAWLDRAGLAGMPLALARRIPGGLPRGAVVLGERALGEAAAEELGDRLLAELERWHARRPLDPGAPRRALARGVFQRLGPGGFDALVAREAGRGRVVVEGPVVRLPAWRVRLDAGQRGALDALEADLRGAGLEGLVEVDVLPERPDREALLAFAVARGRAVRVGSRLVDPAALEALEARVREELAARGTLDTARFKSISGQTRRTAIPLLEWLDARGVTRRRGDVRVPGPAGGRRP